MQKPGSKKQSETLLCLIAGGSCNPSVFELVPGAKTSGPTAFSTCVGFFRFFDGACVSLSEARSGPLIKACVLCVCVMVAIHAFQTMSVGRPANFKRAGKSRGDARKVMCWDLCCFYVLFVFGMFRVYVAPGLFLGRWCPHVFFLCVCCVRLAKCSGGLPVWIYGLSVVCIS